MRWKTCGEQGHWRPVRESKHFTPVRTNLLPDHAYPSPDPPNHANHVTLAAASRCNLWRHVAKLFHSLRAHTCLIGKDLLDRPTRPCLLSSETLSQRRDRLTSGSGNCDCMHQHATFAWGTTTHSMLSSSSSGARLPSAGHDSFPFVSFVEFLLHSCLLPHHDDL